MNMIILFLNKIEMGAYVSAEVLSFILCAHGSPEKAGETHRKICRLLTQLGNGSIDDDLKILDQKINSWTPLAYVIRFGSDTIKTDDEDERSDYELVRLLLRRGARTGDYNTREGRTLLTLVYEGKWINRIQLINLLLQFGEYKLYLHTYNNIKLVESETLSYLINIYVNTDNNFLKITGRKKCASLLFRRMVVMNFTITKKPLDLKLINWLDDNGIGGTPTRSILSIRQLCSIIRYDYLMDDIGPLMFSRFWYKNSPMRVVIGLLRRGASWLVADIAAPVEIYTYLKSQVRKKFVNYTPVELERLRITVETLKSQRAKKLSL